MYGVLETVRVACGLDCVNDEFDDELIPLTNAELATLTHLGVGPKDGMVIEGFTETWESFIDNGPLLALVRQLVGLKVRLVFDPPTSTSVLSAYQEKAKELTWRVIEINEGR